MCLNISLCFGDCISLSFEKVWYSGGLSYSATEMQVQIAWTIAVISCAELIILHFILQYVICSSNLHNL
jgi:hypothetical protein